MFNLYSGACAKSLELLCAEDSRETKARYQFADTPPFFFALCGVSQIPKSSDPLAGVADVNVRDAFVASKSFTLMAADYSQIEVLW